MRVFGRSRSSRLANRHCPGCGVRPWGWTGSSLGFDSLPGVLILELRGAEIAQHVRLKIDAGVRVYFCDPHSPWQRGTNENTNGLLRQYFPKGTDLSMHNAEEIAAVAATLNSRPRKTLAWKTPAEALEQLLLSANNDRVATTI